MVKHPTTDHIKKISKEPIGVKHDGRRIQHILQEYHQDTPMILESIQLSRIWNIAQSNLNKKVTFGPGVLHKNKQSTNCKQTTIDRFMFLS